MSSNAATVQGWVKSVDPSSGRDFYANHITRKTQWEPPIGWQDPTTPVSSARTTSSRTTTTNATTSNGDIDNGNDDDANEPLPSNWEMMRDPTTGTPFYVDHERKITQWTRPKNTAVSNINNNNNNHGSHQPATAVQTGIPFNHRHLSNKTNASSYHQQQPTTDYYYSSTPNNSSNHHNNVDLSDTMPAIEFKVGTVSDALRPNCSHCNIVFSMSKRRHHCRLCGDIFCDACSTHRVTLPLPGPEFEKPVRICDYCNVDVEQGNFFSMRRYLTVLHLFQPGMEKESNTTEEQPVATTTNVNAALSGLTQDLDQMVSSADQLEEKVTIPADILVPVVLKHLQLLETADRAIRCVASLLGLESLAADKTDFAVAIYLYGKKEAVDRILDVLERSGSDRKTLFVQEQAARTIYYLTETKLIGAVTRKSAELASSMSESSNSKVEDEYGTVEDSLDIPRAIRNMLDHASAAGNPNLQRWAAATLKNLILEDQRRSCFAVNEMAAFVASGESVPTDQQQLNYTTHLPELVSTGGVMILGSLIGADDADTRTHAIAALGATIQSTRAVNASLHALSEMSGGEYGSTATMTNDGDIVRAIVSAGGCAGSVAQLLLSADHTVAGMGCQFLSSLVRPLLTDSTNGSEPLTSQYEYDRDMSNMGAYRSAAIEIATGSCLPALLSLARVQETSKGKSSQRPIELRWIAMETVTATILAIGDMGRAWAVGQYEEGLERYGAPSKLKEAIIAINEEDIIEFSLQILKSHTLGQSLGAASTSQETPAMRIRECAGIILSSITSCSAEAITTLQSQNILSSLLLASTDGMMTMTSTIRGDGSPRCAGVLETVSTILMFSWQHPSGSEKDLLDTLIEMIDAGALPYVSKVLRTKVEWESNDKAIGGMKARVAGCRVLCCLFGIALSDSTGIGMRRLMDAVESDASTYRARDRRPNTNGSRPPTNIIEVALGTLQTATNLARVALMGGASANQQGPCYHSSVMDLVEASLLAVGSMCGSSIAPGGSEGTLITGESFLETRSDSYVSRRQEICNVACDVVVRGGRGEPTLLPTMVVGGFGEGSILASLRLSLAIAQNGTKEQHTKLASSGILVPISDLLRSALSRGDIYKFSSSLALVRFCGPYVAAGQGGGLEAVRDAIRVATNVLTLPVNPSATQKQTETQETLKSECISAIEALSRNASLWSSISTDALPSVIKYIYSSASASSPAAINPRERATKCAALRAVLQIVQVPSHAISAAEAGIVGPLGYLISTASDDQEIPLLVLEILHVVAANQHSRAKAGFLESGAIRSICAVIGKSATQTPKEPTDSRADVALLGLDILHSVLRDIEGNESTEMLLQSPMVASFLASIVSEPQFILALCSTILVKTGMVVPRHDAESSGNANFEIPDVYGPPLLKVDERCAGFSNTHESAESLLFSISVYACAFSSEKNDSFWSVALLQYLSGNADQSDALKASAAFVAHFLSLLTKDHVAFTPKDSKREGDFLTITRPLVCHRLLEALKCSMIELSVETNGSTHSDPYLTSVLVGFNVPHICLSLWKDPALLDVAFDSIKAIVDQDPDEVLHLFVEGKDAIMSLFDLLNLDAGFDASANVVEIRRFLASILGQLAESGLLADAVNRYDVRSSAIAALATACLSEEERAPDDDDDMTSNQLSSGLMRCLVELCTVAGEDKSIKNLRLAPAEAAAIAMNLGKKLCHMVLSRFLERTKLKQYEMDEDENILDAPDVAMLCAVAQHDESLQILRSIGGLHALSLIAAEGEVSALVALKKACNGDADVLLEGETYLAMMSLVSSNDHNAAWRKETPTWRELESSSFDLLSSLCSGSTKGRNAVAAATNCESCVQRAMDIVIDLVNAGSREQTPTPSAPSTEVDDTVDDDETQIGSGENNEVVSLERNTSTEISMKDGLELEDINLGVAACSFICSLAAVRVVHTTLCSEHDVIDSLSFLAVSPNNETLQFAALTVVVALAPYVHDTGALDVQKIGEILYSVLNLKVKRIKSNQVLHTAVCGMSVVFDSLDDETQNKVALCTNLLFMQNVKSCIVVRSTTKHDDDAYAVELSYALTAILLSFRGKVFTNDIFSADIVTALMHMVQWRYDPKTTLTDSDSRTWNASVANCLLLLSSLVWRTNDVLATNKIDLLALSNTTLMLARPGKAPRKAIDVKSALTCAIEGTDSTAAIAAQRVICRLFN